MVKNNSLKFYNDAAHEFIVFQIFDIDRQVYVDPAEVEEIGEKVGLSHVPTIGNMRLRQFARSLEEVLAKAEGVGVYGQTRESFVFKSMQDEFAFKVISNQWLLEQGQ